MFTLYLYAALLGGGGGGDRVLSCVIDHILQENNTLFLTRFRTYKIAALPRTKMISKDDIKGLVSLKGQCHEIFCVWFFS
jgi:hypothetical protein